MTAPQAWWERPSAGIGVVLRKARSDRGRSLVDLVASTKIRARYLEALEDERFEDLPPHPFARGFLRTYADELGLDPEPLLQRFAAVAPAAQAGPTAEAQRLEGTLRPARPISPAQRALRVAVVVATGLSVALLISLAGQLREFSRPVTPTGQQETQEPAAQPPAPVDRAQDAQPRTTGLRGPPPAAAATEAPGEGITVDVEARGRSWMLAAVDGVVVFEGFLTAGQSRRWQGASTVTLRVGNAGAIILVVDGRPLGLLGETGEVVSRTFRKGEDPSMPRAPRPSPDPRRESR